MFPQSWLRKLAQWTGRPLSHRPSILRRRPLWIESLESRQLLAQQLLPDLVPWVSADLGLLSGYTIDRNSIPGHTLLRLATASYNGGQGPLELNGGDSHPDKTQDVYQRVYDDAGGYTDTLVGSFVFHESHGHIHFQDFTSYSLRAVTNGGGVGAVLAGGEKTSFCLIDVLPYDLTLPGAPQNRQYVLCGEHQGVSVGWGDIYDRSIPEQWIDITGVPDGQYWLEENIDPDNRLLEVDKSNNIARIQIDLNTQTPSYSADAFEPNDFFSQATDLGTISGTVTENNLTIDSPNNDDYFRFTAGAPGTLTATVTFDRTQGDVESFLYDGSHTLLAATESVGNSEALAIQLQQGQVYYLRVIGYGGGTSPAYSFTLDAPTAPLDPGNDRPSATDIGSLAGQVTFTDSVGNGDSNDYYRLALTGAGTLSASLTGLSDDADLQLLSNAGSVLASSSNSGTANESLSQALNPGTYYIRVFPKSGTPTYTLNIAADYAGNTLGTAKSLGTLRGSQSLTGFLSAGNPDDYYGVTLASAGTLSAVLGSISSSATWQIMDSSGTVLASASTSGSHTQPISVALAAGSYYVHVSRVSGDSNSVLTVQTDFAGNSLANAQVIGTLTAGRQTITDCVGDIDTDDFYRVSLTQAGTLSAALTGLEADVDLQIIHDANNNGVIDSGEIVAAGTMRGTVAESLQNITLAAGTYYVHVLAVAGTSNYNLTLTTHFAGETLGTALNAGTLAGNKTYTGFVNGEESQDGFIVGIQEDEFYRFTLSATKIMGIGLSGMTADDDLYLIKDANSNGQIDPGEVLASSLNGLTTNETIIRSLSAGTYFVQVHHFLDSSNYTLKLIPGASKASKTTLHLSTTSGVYGQDIVIQATVTAVTSALGPPTGSVTFMDGATALGTSPLVNGVAQFDTTALSVGSHAITGVYNGDANFNTSTSAATTEKISKARTTTVLSSNVPTAVFGQTVTLKATLSVTAPGAGSPTGTVTFKEGTTVLGTGTISAGVATLAISTLAVRSHTITASYGGDANFLSSTSTSFAEKINRANTTTVVSTPTNPSGLGQSLTITATVSPQSPGGGIPAGSVTFKDGGVTLGTSALSNGQATWTVSSPALGNHTLTAVYAGNTNYVTSTSASYTQVVKKVSASTVTASVPSSVFGQSVTLTANVVAVSPSTGTPTGTVTFLDGNTVLGSATLANGSATLAVSTLAVGSHALTVSYAGDSNFLGSASSSLSFAVGQASTTVALGSSVNPSQYGQDVTFTATVSAVAPGAGAPSGSISFAVDGIVQATINLDANDQATYTTSALAVGSRVITATYNGDGNFLGSQADPLTQVVNLASASVSLSSSVNPSVFGQSITINVAVAAIAPGTGTPSGQVVLTVDGVDQPPLSLDGSGQASWSTAALPVGTHTIHATYDGDANFSSAASATDVSQVVNPADSQVSLTSSANPSVFGQEVTIMASVTAVAPGAGTPSGNVIFTVDGVDQPPVALDGNGQATWSSSTLDVGDHTITVAYAGDSEFSGSESSAFTQTVNLGPTQVLFGADPNPADLDDVVTLSIQVLAVAPASGTPSGSVTIFDGQTVLTTAVLDPAGTVQVMITGLSEGVHPLTVRFEGDAHFDVSWSPELDLTIE